jgi:hypothetical protein
MAMSYSVYFYSSKSFGNIVECECKGVDFAEATKWFKHHINNVAGITGITQRVTIVDENDMVVAEWRYGEGVIWPRAWPEIDR